MCITLLVTASDMCLKSCLLVLWNTISFLLYFNNADTRVRLLQMADPLRTKNKPTHLIFNRYIITDKIEQSTVCFLR